MDVEDIAHTIERFVRSHFSVSPRDPRFGPTARLFDDGYVDSMGVAELIAFIEDAFGVAVPDEALMSDEFATIAGMARVVAGLRGASAARERVAAGGEP
ncbi:MAG TPA: acyl carrier protein [Longimicrobiales bacterium]|nr:acyl carrier protein [Longimicrobiales bacterium]